MKDTRPLIWLDLEMTGLCPEKDTILEIATVITDSDLRIIEVGPELVVFQDEQQLTAMNEWCQEHHHQSGLVDRVRRSSISLVEAEEKTVAFLARYTEKEQSPLCGNSVHQDRQFLRRHLPKVHDHLHYRNIDVSSIKELTYLWYPQLPKFEKRNRHTALADIRESIEELKYYRHRIFKEAISIVSK